MFSRSGTEREQAEGPSSRCGHVADRVCRFRCLCGSGRGGSGENNITALITKRRRGLDKSFSVVSSAGWVSMGPQRNLEAGS